MNTNDVIRMVTATGGGYGDPFKRPADKVAMDVKNEYITVDQAKEGYGVLVDPETFKVLGLTEERQKAENNLTIIKSEMSTDTNAVNLYIFKTMISEKVAFFNCILL